MHGFYSDIKATEINQPYSVNIIVFNVNCLMILMNHGGLTLGPFFKAKFLACRVQIFCHTLNPLRLFGGASHPEVTAPNHPVDDYIYRNDKCKVFL